ncbi:MAG: aspartate aminotransferase family protein, partial [Dehalococcoidia bacterium]
DVEMFVGYRQELMRHGVFELPLNLKRSHISYAHTDAHIDTLVAATREAVQTVLERRGHPVASSSVGVG